MSEPIEHTQENYERLLDSVAELTALRASLRDEGEYDEDILKGRSEKDLIKLAQETTIRLWQHSTNNFRTAFWILVKEHPLFEADALTPLMPYDYVEYEGDWKLPISMLLNGMQEAIEYGPDNDGSMIDFVVEDDDELEPGYVESLWDSVVGGAASLGEAIVETGEDLGDKAAEPLSQAADTLNTALKWGTVILGLTAAIVIVPRVLPKRA